jgi:hypothetical protein
VEAEAKAGLLALVDDAVGQGWSLRRACRVLELEGIVYHRFRFVLEQTFVARAQVRQSPAW